MPQTSLSVPFALAPDGSFVLPRDADPEASYACPGCGAPLLLRKSTTRRAHFAHRRGEGCATESVVHRAAKGLVLRVIEEWLAKGGPRPCIQRPCPVWSCDGGVVQDLPDDITHATAEVRLPDGSVGDVVLFRGEEPACVVEILATHAVDAEKAGRLTVPWIEVDADDLFDRPYWWVAVQDGLRPFACPKCRARSEVRGQELGELQAEGVTLAGRLGTPLPPSPPYGFLAHRCWRCSEEMVLFLWPGSGAHSAKPPPPPRPTTVRLCATEGYGAEYWANCCPSCHAVQGDYHLRTGSAAYARVRELMVEEEGD
jgi:predicted RNA-binding Zn-ribbon protein involved in translation (DUF1610 family)